jgi:hypothetical protein
MVQLLTKAGPPWRYIAIAWFPEKVQLEIVIKEFVNVDPAYQITPSPPTFPEKVLFVTVAELSGPI